MIGQVVRRRRPDDSAQFTTSPRVHLGFCPRCVDGDVYLMCPAGRRAYRVCTSCGVVPREWYR